jgi:hypothetical protein
MNEKLIETLFTHFGASTLSISPKEGGGPAIE